MHSVATIIKICEHTKSDSSDGEKENRDGDGARNGESWALYLSSK